MNSSYHDYEIPIIGVSWPIWHFETRNMPFLSGFIPNKTRNANWLATSGWLQDIHPNSTTWYTYPSEKYESQLMSVGMMTFPIYGKTSSKPPTSHSTILNQWIHIPHFISPDGGCRAKAKLTKLQRTAMCRRNQGPLDQQLQWCVSAGCLLDNLAKNDMFNLPENFGRKLLFLSRWRLLGSWKWLKDVEGTRTAGNPLELRDKQKHGFPWCFVAKPIHWEACWLGDLGVAQQGATTAKLFEHPCCAGTCWNPHAT
jgi:hypothetical protein